MTIGTLAGCRGEDEAAARQAGAASGTGGRPSAVQPARGTYRELPGIAGGSVRVAVRLAGEPPADSTWAVPDTEQTACGAAVADASVARTGDRLADAVVWLPDVRQGKPLPLERRHELTISRCVMAPRVQVAVAGGTLNLRALDDVAHRTRFARLGEPARPIEIATTEPVSVVPDEEVLRKPGQVEVSCARHPWARAWLFAFDTPYAAVSAADGTATLADVPPGRWRVRVWHERFGVREDSVTVTAGADATVEVQFGSGN